MAAPLKRRTMETTEFISVIALCASIGSAVYARWSGQATQRANEIAIHSERLKIYKGLLEFRAFLTTRGPGFPDEALWQFADLVLLSEFYFSSRAHEAMKALLEDANQIKARHDHWQQTKESGRDSTSAVQAMHELHRATREQCAVVAELMKPDMLLHSSKPTWIF